MPQATFKTIDSLDVSGKRVLVRVDLNVPMKDGQVTDATRIERASPTLAELAAKGAKVIVLSHFGRPAGKHPARGWDSYDAFDLQGLNEARVLQQAEVIASIPEGEFRYLVLDEGGAEHIGPQGEKNGWLLDEYCRPYPNPQTFPGSNGTGSLIGR